MKKIKKLWTENRVLFVLFVIVLICVFLILGVMLKYFFGTSKSGYGDRLNGIEEVPITEQMQNDFLNQVKSDEQVREATIHTSGKIIYISIQFMNGSSLEDAENKALASLDFFEEKYKNFYDFQFTLKKDASEEEKGFLIMGAKNVNGSGLSWNNNTEIEEKEE